jgi:hypothetical protein
MALSGDWSYRISACRSLATAILSSAWYHTDRMGMRWIRAWGGQDEGLVLHGGRRFGRPTPSSRRGGSANLLSAIPPPRPHSREPADARTEVVSESIDVAFVLRWRRGQEGSQELASLVPANEDTGYREVRSSVLGRRSSLHALRLARGLAPPDPAPASA